MFFADGFESYAAGDLPLSWDAVFVDDWGNISLLSTSPRYSGGKYIRLQGAGPYYITKNFTNVNTVTAGFAFKTESLAGNYGFRFINETGIQLTIYVNVDGSISAYKGTTVILGTSAAGIVTVETWMYMEIKVCIHDTTGTYEVRLNGVSVLSGSGADTKAQTTSGCSGIRFHGFSDYSYLDDVVIHDGDFLGDVRVDDVLPTGAGNYAQFTPSAGANFECVDDTDIDNDTTYVSSETVGHKDSYAMGDLSAIGADIHAVIACVTARKDDAGTRKIKPLIRIAGTDYEGDEISLGDSYHTYQHVWLTNPADSAAFEEADVNAMEAGQELTE